MIELQVWPTSSEAKPLLPHVGRRGWRWVLALSWIEIGLYREVRFYDRQNVWSGPIQYLCVGLRWQWRFGGYHGYYDGPHCAWMFGPLWFGRSLGECAKCG